MWIDLKEAGRKTKPPTSYSTLRQWVRQKKIRSSRPARKVLVWEPDLDAFLSGEPRVKEGEEDMSKKMKVEVGDYLIQVVDRGGTSNNDLRGRVLRVEEVMERDGWQEIRYTHQHGPKSLRQRRWIRVDYAFRKLQPGEVVDILGGGKENQKNLEGGGKENQKSPEEEGQLDRIEKKLDFLLDALNG